MPDGEAGGAACGQGWHEHWRQWMGAEKPPRPQALTEGHVGMALLTAEGRALE